MSKYHKNIEAFWLTDAEQQQKKSEILVQREMFVGFVFGSLHVTSSGTRLGERENKCLEYRKNKDEFLGVVDC